MPPDEIADESSIAPKPGRSWEWAALFLVILVASGLRIWKLDQNGTGNPYYGACVRSMLASGTNFFFGSFDPIGIVTVDKPPVALWVQATSVKLFGYSGLSVLLPQALMGVISVVLTYALVRRCFGAGAGLLAGLALAVTPISVAIDRDNLPDTALILTLLLATWSLTRASESGRLGPLLGAMALVGLAFNIKMLAAFVVLPTFVLAYWMAAPVGWRTRFVRLAAAGVILVATSLSWSIAVELTPKTRRPYIGGSSRNSALELALGYNGIARIFGMGGGRPGGPPGNFGPSVPDTAKVSKGQVDQTEENDKKEKAGRETSQGNPPMFPGGPGMGPPPFGPGGPGGMPGFGGTPGIGRFANAGIAGLITWLFPLAIAGSLVAASRSKVTWPIGREHLALAIWAGWFVTHWVVFSFARGIFHEYYTVAMGPAVAALAGIGIVALWETSRRGGWRALLLPAVILMTVAWQASIVNHYPEWRRWLLPTLCGGAVVGSIGLLASSRWDDLRRSRSVGLISASIGLATLWLCPTLWSFSPVLVAGNALLPSADPSMLGVVRDQPSGMMFPPGAGFGMEANPAETQKMVDFLVTNRHGESILVAGVSSMDIAPIIIHSGEPAVSIGGFMGMDRSLTKDQFVKLVESGGLRFFLVSPGPGGGGGPGGPPGFGSPPGAPGGPNRGPFPPGGPMGMGNSEILAWVREHGQSVESKFWKNEEPEEADAPAIGAPFDPVKMFKRMRRLTQLYDCRPELGLVAAPAR